MVSGRCCEAALPREGRDPWEGFVPGCGGPRQRLRELQLPPECLDLEIHLRLPRGIK